MLSSWYKLLGHDRIIIGRVNPNNFVPARRLDMKGNDMCYCACIRPSCMATSGSDPDQPWLRVLRISRDKLARIISKLYCLPHVHVEWSAYHTHILLITPHLQAHHRFWNQNNVYESAGSKAIIPDTLCGRFCFRNLASSSSI